MAATAAEAAEHPVLRDDEGGTPRSLRLLAALVEADALRNAAAAASRPATSELVRAFRGAAATASRSAESELVCAFRVRASTAPTVSVTEFLERVHRYIKLEGVRQMIRLEGTSYVLAGIYLNRFMRSPAAMEAGILVEPTTAHRLVSVALFIGAKFGGPDDLLPLKWTSVFEVSSDCATRANEMVGLEEHFLRAVDFRLFVNGKVFDWFCNVMEQALPPPESRSCGANKRKVAAVEDGREDDCRRVRPCLPPPAIVAN